MHIHDEVNRQNNAFKIVQGQVNLENGIRSYTNKYDMYFCVNDGDLKVVYKDGEIVILEMKANTAFSFEYENKDNYVDTIEILSGRFHIGN